MKLIKLEDQNTFCVEEISRLYFTSKTLSERKLRRRARKILDNIENHKEVMEMLKEICLLGLSVIFTPHSEMEHNASWDGFGRAIRIADHISDTGPLLDSFIFELCNANNIGYGGLNIEDYDSSAKYAKRFEEIEYNTYCETVRLETLGLKNYGWPRRWFSRKAVTLEAYTARTQESRREHHGYSHFENYQMHFLRFTLNSLYNHRLLFQISLEDDQKVVNEKVMQLEDKIKLYEAEKLSLEETVKLRLSAWEETSCCFCLFSSESLNKKYIKWERDRNRVGLGQTLMA